MADDDVQGEVYLDNRSKKLRARNIVVVKTGLRKKAEALEASLLSAATWYVRCSSKPKKSCLFYLHK